MIDGFIYQKEKPVDVWCSYRVFFFIHECHELMYSDVAFVLGVYLLVSSPNFDEICSLELKFIQDFLRN